MVVGLDKFAEHFAGHRDGYVLIGGAAAWLVLDEAGLETRATKDLDIVLCVEVLDAAFVKAFWAFVQAGGYELQEKSTGEKIFYRFRKPAVEGYPVMLELFSRQPDGLVLGDDSHLTPIPVGQEVPSLSAILLNDDYYAFLHAHKREIEGVPVVSEECLILLKASAWLDLTRRKADGDNIGGRDINKHRNDVLRLYRLLSPDLRIELPETIRDDLDAFLREVTEEINTHLLTQLGVSDVSPADVIGTIRSVYGVP